MLTDEVSLIFQNKFIQSINPSPLIMIVLHGRGDSINPFLKFREEVDYPYMNYLLLNAPRKYLDGYSWYGEPPYQLQGVLRVRKKMFSVIDILIKNGWKSKNIFLLGFSQGCLISADVALNYPHGLAGFIGISGYFQFYPYWKQKLNSRIKKTPWLITHGKKDEVLPLQKTKSDVDKLKVQGLKIKWVEMDKDHNFIDEDYSEIKKYLYNTKYRLYE